MIGILELTHASLKESLKIMKGERRTMWHQFLPMAVLNYKLHTMRTQQSVPRASPLQCTRPEIRAQTTTPHPSQQ